jgi:transposase-like protein
MVSNAAKKLDEVLNTWRERPLGKIEYLVVDAICNNDRFFLTQIISFFCLV